MRYRRSIFRASQCCYELLLKIVLMPLAGEEGIVLLGGWGDGEWWCVNCGPGIHAQADTI